MTVMTVAVMGLIFLVTVATVVGILDATRAPRWRRIAAERREEWEARHPAFHGDIDNADED